MAIGQEAADGDRHHVEGSGLGRSRCQPASTARRRVRAGALARETRDLDGAADGLADGRRRRRDRRARRPRSDPPGEECPAEGVACPDRVDDVHRRHLDLALEAPAEGLHGRADRRWR